MITKRDRHYIDICFTAARDLKRTGGARIIALLIYKNTNILAWGHNQEKTHPLQAQYAKNDKALFLHAEIDAIRNMLRQLDPDDMRHCTLYVARAKYDNNLKKEIVYGEAKPCIGRQAAINGCQAAITAFQLKKVLYTTDDGTIEEL